MLCVTPFHSAAAEESSSEGILVRDKLLLPDAGTADVVFGCETKETGEIYRQQADGLMGLGSSDISVINQVCQYDSSRVSEPRSVHILWCRNQRPARCSE